MRAVFYKLLDDCDLPRPKPEYEFHHERNWRLDYCWPDAHIMLALEIEGGAWTNGRHTRGSGFLNDMEKYNALACCGYRLIRVTPDKLLSRETLDLIREAING